MRRFFYISFSMVLGVMLSFIIHVILEGFVIWMMIKDFDKFGLGLTWDQLLFIHLIYSVALFVVGVILGLSLGVRWYKWWSEEKHFASFSFFKFLN